MDEILLSWLAAKVIGFDAKLKPMYNSVRK